MNMAHLVRSSFFPPKTQWLSMANCEIPRGIQRVYDYTFTTFISHSITNFVSSIPFNQHFHQRNYHVSTIFAS